MSDEGKAFYCIAKIKGGPIKSGGYGIDNVPLYTQNKISALVSIYKQLLWGGIMNITPRNNGSGEDLGRIEDTLNIGLRKIEFAVGFRNDLGSYFPKGRSFVYFNGTVSVEIAKEVLIYALATSTREMEPRIQMINQMTSQQPIQERRSNDDTKQHKFF